MVRRIVAGCRAALTWSHGEKFVGLLSTLLTHGEQIWEGGLAKRAMIVRNIVGRPVLRSDSLQDGSRPFQIEPARLFSVCIQQNFSPTFVTRTFTDPTISLTMIFQNSFTKTYI